MVTSIMYIYFQLSIREDGDWYMRVQNVYAAHLIDLSCLSFPGPSFHKRSLLHIPFTLSSHSM